MSNKISRKRGTNIISQFKNRETLTRTSNFKQYLKNIYKVFYEFKENNNPNRGFICVVKNLFHIFINRDLNLYSYLKTPINISIFKYCSLTEDVEYEKEPEENFKRYLKEFINGLFDEYGIDIKRTNFNFNNLYISEDESTLYYIEKNYIHNFNILNKKVLDYLDELPSIVLSCDESKFNDKNKDNTINLLSVKEESSNNIYTPIYDVQLFYFKKDNIEMKEIEPSKHLKLDGDIKNWYFIPTALKIGNQIEPRKYLDIRQLNKGKEILQFVYITPEIIKKYNQYYSYYKIPLSFHIIESDRISIFDYVEREEIRNIYKIFYKFNDSNNPNKGYLCIFKDLFKVDNKFKLYERLKFSNKIKKVVYCISGERELRFKPRNSNIFENYLLELIDFIIHTRDIDISNAISYNNLYLSEDESILYYIEDNYLHNFNVLNKNIQFLDKFPNIEYSLKLSISNNSTYHTINLNNNLSLSNIVELIFNSKNKYMSKFDVQLFYFENNKIIIKEIKKNIGFYLQGDIRNWYFISTTLKIGEPEFIYLNKLHNGRKIIQFIYILPEKINEYNELFLNLKMPLSFVKISLTKKTQLKPLYSKKNISKIGGNKKKKNLKIY